MATRNAITNRNMNDLQRSDGAVLDVYALDHPELEPLPSTELRYFAMRKGHFERGMRGLQKKVLRRLADRPKQVTKAVISMIARAHGPNLHSEQAIRQAMDL